MLPKPRINYKTIVQRAKSKWKSMDYEEKCDFLYWAPFKPLLFVSWAFTAYLAVAFFIGILIFIFDFGFLIIKLLLCKKKN